MFTSLFQDLLVFSVVDLTSLFQDLPMFKNVYRLTDSDQFGMFLPIIVSGFSISSCVVLSGVVVSSKKYL